MQLDRKSPQPLYSQLEEIIRAFIQSGEWQPNKIIPSEREICEQYGLSRITVRSVLSTLVQEGLLRRVQGKGTFVTEAKISTTSPAYMGIREQLEQQGFHINTRLIQFKVLRASFKIAGYLEIKPDDEVVFIERIRSLDSTPISIHRSFLPKALCGTLSSAYLENEQLCVIIEREFGFKVATVTETLESVPAKKDEAALLQVPGNFSLLMLEDINRTSDGLVFEYTQVLFRADKVKLHFTYGGN
jgi:GntR family transcriptional regulator